MRTNTKGDIAELMISTRYLELGYWVSEPIGDDAPYDRIVDDKKGNLYRVQCKYLAPYRDALIFRLDSSTGKKYKTDVDLMAGYNPEDKKVYVINPSEYDAKTMVRLLLREAKNNRKQGIHLASKYIL